MMRNLLLGAAAGAAGTTALNAVTYLDMAMRGRGTSSTPEQTVAAAAAKAGVDIPGEGEVRDNRLQGLGALSGIATGVAVGAVVATMDGLGLRPGRLGGSLLSGALAMAASDVSMTRLGVTDPRTWSAPDWAADVVPHFAYGLVTYSTLRAVEQRY
jgi:hypothetical protein